MLYVTTRMQQDAFTAHRTLTDARGPEGGFFVPMRLPHLTAEELSTMTASSFGHGMAAVLNLFFGTTLDSWDVDFCIGRYPARVVNLGSRVFCGELWHNPHWKFSRLVRNLQKILISEPMQVSSEWLPVAVRIGALFGLYADMHASGCLGADGRFDVAVPSGDFSAPMAVWYARKMGLPIANIICTCNENSTPWNLLHQGSIRMDTAVVKTTTPDCDHNVPAGLERLIYESLGMAESLRYCQSFEQGSTYYLDESSVSALRSGMYVSVVSQNRVDSMIGNLYKTAGYIADPYAALAYSGLINYRSRTGESRPALVLSEYSPAHFLDTVSKGLGITPKELKYRIEKG